MKQDDRVRINANIKALELRVIGAEGENLGVISRDEAIEKAKEAGLDLIEVSPKATPPVARIIDYGKYQYEQKKKQKDIKQKATTTETKTVQVKIGTGEHDKELKAKRVSLWLSEGHRVRADLFLFGRYKYMDETFLKDRLNQFLTLIDEPYKIADDMKKGPKGYTITLERDKAGKKVQEEKKGDEAENILENPTLSSVNEGDSHLHSQKSVV